MKAKMRQGFLGMIAAGLMISGASLRAEGQLLLADDFSDGNYTANPTWTVEKGSITAGSGFMSFTPDVNTRVYVDFAALTGTGVTISFNLRQTNITSSSYIFSLTLADAQTGLSYTENASPNVNYYGGAPNNSGFHSYVGDGVLIAGTAGVSLNADGAWQTITAEFAPGTGVTIKKDGVTAATWSNYKNITRVNRLIFENPLGGSVALNWLVDEVTVNGEAVPGPQFCGDEGTVYPAGDISGAAGQPDCYVDGNDLAKLSGEWQDCTDPANSNCTQPHATSLRNDLAIQTLYRGGVPHTNKNGAVRLTYSESESFLPIGTWGAPLSSADFHWDNLVSAGYNTVWPWSSPATDALACGAQFNIQIVLMHEQSEATLTAIMNHANLLGNVWRDEPPLTGAESTETYNNFVAYRSFVHGIAPTLPVWVNNVPWISDPALPMWIQFTQAGDVACHDNYPIKPLTNTIGANPNGIPQVALLSAQTVNSQKPVWFIVGAFTQRNTPDSSFPFRMPTAEQLRCQVYAGLIHGATGIHYFIWDSYISRDGQVIGMTPAPKVQFPPMVLKATPMELNRGQALWKAAAQINSELKTLTPALLSPTAGTAVGYQVAITGDGIIEAPLRCILKQDPAGGYVLMTVNLDEAILKASYTFASKISEAAVLFENRGPMTLTQDNHQFTDYYEPYDTHVYHITLAN